MSIKRFVFVAVLFVSWSASTVYGCGPGSVSNADDGVTQEIVGKSSRIVIIDKQLALQEVPDGMVLTVSKTLREGVIEVRYSFTSDNELSPSVVQRMKMRIRKLIKERAKGSTPESSKTLFQRLVAIGVRG